MRIRKTKGHHTIKEVFFLFCVPFLIDAQGLSPAQGGKGQIRGQATLSWESHQIHVRAALALTPNGIQLPTGRTEAMERLTMEFPAQIRPFFLNLQVSSTTTIADLLKENTILPDVLDTYISSASPLSTYIDFPKDELVATYTFPLHHLLATLIQHTRPRSLPRPLTTVASRPYTGIIIIAKDPLPIHGKKETSYLIPCLFPRIWDSAMNLVYERTMVDPTIARQNGIVHYTNERAILLPTPSGLQNSLIPLVGEYPLRILAEGVFGVTPTDPIINREDALRILSNEENRELLRQGRMIMVIADQQIEQTFSW
ncbi:polymerase [Treponema sp. J25]|uniref:polymerase n=1 Tax=Treponema sp. J25 TaxID=2094121 RepID=UPI0010480DC9|nr:polymerase [Treponema sp. J25]TCW61254.1 polymerase [Treponema sp. J25]